MSKNSYICRKVSIDDLITVYTCDILEFPFTNFFFLCFRIDRKKFHHFDAQEQRQCHLEFRHQSEQKQTDNHSPTQTESRQ